MFAVEIDNSVIGKYLGTEIRNHYKNVRSFCKDYIKHKGLDSSDVNLLNKYQNRIGQILSGEKGIQLHDLPYFSEMLGLSCEAILSAGRYHVPESTHVTNYDIAHSDKKSVWKKYMEREDKLFLNADEYGKTVIDYALDFKNYKFIKYLLDNKFIWLVGPEKDWVPDSYIMDTVIKERSYASGDYAFKNKYQLNDLIRTRILAFMIEMKDTKSLDEYKAREVPLLEWVSGCGVGVRTDIKNLKNDVLIDAVANASQEVADYFSDEFVVRGRWNQNVTFVFPYLEELIEKTIELRRFEMASKMIKKAIEHNNNAYDGLSKTIDNSWKDSQKSVFKEYDRKLILENFGIKNNIVNFQYYTNEGDAFKYATNIVNVKTKSGTPEIQKLVAELNESYQRILDLKEEK